MIRVVDLIVTALLVALCIILCIGSAVVYFVQFAQDLKPLDLALGFFYLVIALFYVSRIRGSR